MIVIRGGAATPLNKDFIKTKQHSVFHGGGDHYNTYIFLQTDCDTSVYCYDAKKCCGVND